MDPPTPVGRCLGCERRLSERWIFWHCEDPAALDLPPLEAKTKDAAGASNGFYDPTSVKAAGVAPVCSDRFYLVPCGHSVRVRYDADAKRFRPSIPSGPDW
eukprot:4457636-Pyramimonas_sp.AAC.1